MRAPLRMLLLLAAMLLAPGLASAAYNCSITSPGFATAYSPTVPTDNVTPTYFTITCTRGLGDANTMSWTAAANNGMYPRGGGRNRAAFGGNRINYDVYKDSGCGTQWRTGGNAITGSLNFGGGTSASLNVTYYGCVPAGQTGLPAGTYTDTVTMTLTYGPFSFTDTGTFGVSITTPATCNLTNAPGNVVFNYITFGSAVNASTTYGVTCSNTLAYTMALDATSGTIIGLNYTLALSAASGTGTGAEQSYTINGSMAAAQAGTCATGSCSASQARTLTVTY
jgi:spore coat protein U-like protein